MWDKELLLWIKKHYHMAWTVDQMLLAPLSGYPHMAYLSVPDGKFIVKITGGSEEKRLFLNSFFVEACHLPYIEVPCRGSEGDYVLRYGENMLTLYRRLSETGAAPDAAWWAQGLAGVHQIKIAFSEKFLKECSRANAKKLLEYVEADRNKERKLPECAETDMNNTGKLPECAETDMNNTGKLPECAETDMNNTGKLPAEMSMNKVVKKQLWTMLPDTDMAVSGENGVFVFSHGDALVSNVMVSADKYRLIDFDSAGWAYREYDIQRMMSDYLIRTGNLELCLKFWYSFRKDYEKTVQKTINVKLFDYLYRCDLVQTMAWLFIVSRDKKRADRQRQKKELDIYIRRLESGIHQEFLRKI